MDFRYMQNAYQFADELFDLLDPHEHEKKLLRLVEERLETVYNPSHEVLVFLEKTPAQRAKSFAKLQGDDALVFWLQARCAALRAANAAAVAQEVQAAANGSYRKAFRAFVGCIQITDAMPPKEDIVFLWKT